MLSVPFPDKKIEVTGDPFLPAITGDHKDSFVTLGNMFIIFLEDS